LKPLTFQLSSGRVAAHWLVAAGLVAAAVVVYFFLFWLPYQGITLKGCPSACSYNTDCNVPGCGTPIKRQQTQVKGSTDIQIDRNKAQISCSRGKCQLAGGHKHFFGAAVVFILFFLGLLAGGATRLTIDDEGIHYHRLHTDLHIPWDSFLGITYHGVNTRMGQDATVYSISGDTGLLSFIVPGLPQNTSTRELELGASFFLKLDTAQRDELVAAIKEKTDTEPEPEYEW